MGHIGALASPFSSLTSQVQARGLLFGERFEPQCGKCLESLRGVKVTGQCQSRNVPPEKGRCRSARKASAEGVQRRMKARETDMEGWTQVRISADLQEGKNKAIIHNNKGYVLVKRGSDLRAIEANCTSCKFPVIEGKVTEKEDGELHINCPLCHTTFSLFDGRVVEFCPKDGPVQWLIGTLKERSKPENAKVFPARISNSGRVYVQFATVRII